MVEDRENQSLLDLLESVEHHLREELDFISREIVFPNLQE